MGTSSVRRNLFQNHLSRRPVSTSAPSNGPSGLSSQVLQHSAPESNSPLSTGPVDDGEIVVKDKNGRYRLDTPVLPPIVGEDGDEMEGIEGTGTGGSSTAATGADSMGQGEMSGREKEKMEANLVEMMYRNRNRQMSNEPHEILNLIYQSLRNKVATLEEDNWMYEPEHNIRV
ncbi:hypothetical protein BDW59DRAFT_175837 [Aspergillus cavernicola]|uniref:Uncharacterized protein n=1 Tax=Aspergillus cavernicola TaxID=176166 RepID=A0ABR4HLP4_9EURO